MSTYQLSILGPNTNPDTSGNVFFEPYPLKATNDIWKMLVAIFNDTATKLSLYGQFTVPQNYVGGGTFVFIWTAQLTTGNVVWTVDYRTVGGDDTTSLDQATAEETLSVTDAAPTATDRRLTPSVAATAANFAAGETVEFFVSRDGASGSDTMAGAATLVDVLFQYTD